MANHARYIFGHLFGWVSIGAGVLGTQPPIANSSPQPTQILSKHISNRYSKLSVITQIIPTQLTCRGIPLWVPSSASTRCQPTGSMTAQNSQLQPKKLPRVVFFGSSTTVGFGTTRGDRRWTTLLSRYLGWEEINEGLSGSTVSTALRNTPELASVPSAIERWRKNVLSRTPDRVVLLYGVNDAFRRVPVGTTQQRGTYSGDLTKMLTDMAQEFKPQQLIISTAQPNQGTLDRRKDYDRVLVETTKQIGGYLIDAGTEAFPLADLPDYSADGLHLNNLGHAIFASYLANKIVNLGIEPAPPQAQGGNLGSTAVQPLPGGFLYIDRHQPLTFGRVRTIILSVTAGVSQVEVPNWWALEGDRLAVWTEGNCLGGYELPANSVSHLAVSQGNIIRDIPANRGHLADRAMAIHIIP
jgi:lysophospholipase L1-like esterase